MTSEANRLFTWSGDQDCVVIQILIDQLRTPETCHALKDELRSFLGKTKSEKILFDFANVEFMGSVAFLAFLALRREKLVDQIKIFNVSDGIHKMLQACKLIPSENVTETPFVIVEPE